MTKDEEKLIESYPVQPCCPDDSVANTLYMAFDASPDERQETIPNTGTLVFRKGGMPFRVDLKRAPKTKRPYLSVTMYGSDLPRFIIPVGFVSLKSIYQKVGETIDNAFRQDLLDPKLIRPHEYFTEEDDDYFYDYLELIDHSYCHPEGREHYDIIRCDVGDVRLTLSYRRDYFTTEAVAEDYNVDLSLAIMKDPEISGRYGVIKCSRLEMPDTLKLCTKPSEVRDFLNGYLTALTRGEKDNTLATALESTDYKWMQYELWNATLFHDLGGYIGIDGQPHDTENDMTTRESRQFCHVVADALLKEPVSRTLWLNPAGCEPSSKEEVPLADYKILGLSPLYDYPVFDARLANGRKILLSPEEFIPSQMKANGCSYTEKEYGIPTELIPKPLEERGIFGIVPAICHDARLKQARPVLQKELLRLGRMFHDGFHLTPKDITNLVHEFVPESY